jgi:hypothetical protein
VIASNPTPVSVVVFSRHALDQLEARRISPALVEGLLEQPFMTGPSRGALYSAGIVTDGRRRVWLTVLHSPPVEGRVEVITIYVGVTASWRSVKERRRERRSQEGATP